MLRASWFKLFRIWTPNRTQIYYKAGKNQINFLNNKYDYNNDQVGHIKINFFATIITTQTTEILFKGA